MPNIAPEALKVKRQTTKTLQQRAFRLARAVFELRDALTGFLEVGNYEQKRFIRQLADPMVAALDHGLRQASILASKDLTAFHPVKNPTPTVPAPPKGGEL